MAISVDWLGTGSTPGGVAYEIYVPKADLTPTADPDFFDLDIDTFRIALRELEATVAGRPWPQTHYHTTEVAVGGIVLARVMEVLDPYSITFEDGQYGVNLVGANSNIGGRVNLNQVSVRSFNSAGLTAPAVPPTVEEITAGVWSEPEPADSKDGSLGAALSLVRKFRTNRLELVDGASNNWNLYDDDDSLLMTLSVKSKSGGAIVLQGTVPAQRTKGV